MWSALSGFVFTQGHYRGLRHSQAVLGGLAGLPLSHVAQYPISGPWMGLGAPRGSMGCLCSPKALRAFSGQKKRGLWRDLVVGAPGDALPARSGGRWRGGKPRGVGVCTGKALTPLCEAPSASVGDWVLAVSP